MKTDQTFFFSAIMESIKHPLTTEAALYQTYLKRLKKLKLKNFGITWGNIEEMDKIFLEKATKNKKFYPNFNRILENLNKDKF